MRAPPYTPSQLYALETVRPNALPHTSSNLSSHSSHVLLQRRHYALSTIIKFTSLTHSGVHAHGPPAYATPTNVPSTPTCHRGHQPYSAAAAAAAAESREATARCTWSYSGTASASNARASSSCAHVCACDLRPACSQDGLFHMSLLMRNETRRLEAQEVVCRWAQLSHAAHS